MDLQQQLEKLSNLYAITHEEWEITVHQSLTEPTCPTVIINPEGMHATRYRVDCDTIEAGVMDACERVYQEIFCGRTIESSCPFTNPDDVELAKKIPEWQEVARAKGFAQSS